jgi:hypothetical protein
MAKGTKPKSKSNRPHSSDKPAAARKGVGSASDKQVALTVALVEKFEQAVVKTDNMQWAIGDQLNKAAPLGERGPSNGSNEILAKIVKVLQQEKGLKKYSASHLRWLRDTSAHFRHAERSASVSHSVHALARKPGKLKRAMQRAKSKGEPLTASFMRKLNAEDRQKEKGQASAAGRFHESLKKTRTAWQSTCDWFAELTAPERTSRLAALKKFLVEAADKVKVFEQPLLLLPAPRLDAAA